MQRTRFALIALIVGIVGLVAVTSVWLYFRPEPKATAKKPAEPKPITVVLTASKDLEIGSLITANDVAWSPLKNGAIHSAHLVKGKTHPSEVVGSVVRRAVFKGTPLTWSSIVRPGQYGFLAAALKADHRAVTIMVNRATSQAGLIYPGDRVDVILTMEVKGGARKNNTFTGTILEDIRVVAVNRQVESSAGVQGQTRTSRRSRNSTSTVTLEVLPSEAERLILATSRGDISLAMRPLTDGRRRDKRTPTAFENLLSLPPLATATEPSPGPAPALPPAQVPNPVRVQVFRGGDHQEVILRK